MSIWTHITGCIRVDDMKMILQPNNKTDFSKIFIRNTWYHPNEDGNLPSFFALAIFLRSIYVIPS